jgi:hypothetical protein
MLSRLTDTGSSARELVAFSPLASIISFLAKLSWSKRSVWSERTRNLEDRKLQKREMKVRFMRKGRCERCVGEYIVQRLLTS